MLSLICIDEKSGKKGLLKIEVNKNKIDINFNENNLCTAEISKSILSIIKKNSRNSMLSTLDLNKDTENYTFICNNVVINKENIIYSPNENLLSLIYKELENFNL